MRRFSAILTPCTRAPRGRHRSSHQTGHGRSRTLITTKMVWRPGVNLQFMSGINDQVCAVSYSVALLQLLVLLVSLYRLHIDPPGMVVEQCQGAHVASRTAQQASQEPPTCSRVFNKTYVHGLCVASCHSIVLCGMLTTTSSCVVLFETRW